MLPSYTKVKQTAKKYRLPIAIGVTAVVTQRYTRNTTRNQVIQDVANLTYKWGQETGVLAVQNGVMLDFINAKGLAHELSSHILSLESAEVLVETLTA